jgi:2-succinyl-6-hydroxy-2,4-cyclohexadiene-1-carboxylate synthase
MQIDKINIELTYYYEYKESRPVILFLHGFTGSSEDWRETAEILKALDYNLLGIDLPGHGKSSTPDKTEYYRLPFLIKIIKEIIKNTGRQKIVLAGYSMGGRLALAYAAQYPNDISQLILESTSPGIAEPEGQMDRVKSDNKIIEIIKEKNIDEFIDYWMSIPLFESQRKYRAKFNLLRQTKLKNISPNGLINSLKGFGTGVMPQQYNNLKNILCPVLLITGSLDSKFTGINKNIASLLPDAQHIIIEGAGHNIHFEKPDEFCKPFMEFISRIS